MAFAIQFSNDNPKNSFKVELWRKFFFHLQSKDIKKRYVYRTFSKIYRHAWQMLRWLLLVLRNCVTAHGPLLTYCHDIKSALRIGTNLHGWKWLWHIIFSPDWYIIVDLNSKVEITFPNRFIYWFCILQLKMNISIILLVVYRAQVPTWM